MGTPAVRIADQNETTPSVSGESCCGISMITSASRCWSSTESERTIIHEERTQAFNKRNSWSGLNAEATSPGINRRVTRANP